MWSDSDILKLERAYYEKSEFMISVARSSFYGLEQCKWERRAYNRI